MPATSAAITSLNTTLAIQAADDANNAHIERCKTEILTFKKESATIEQTQSYASCVLKIHPIRTESEISSMKFVVCLFLILFIIGFAYGVYKEWHGSITDKIAIGFLDSLMSIVFGLVLGMLYLAVKFVIS